MSDHEEFETATPQKPAGLLLFVVTSTRGEQGSVQNFARYPCPTEVAM